MPRKTDNKASEKEAYKVKLLASQSCVSRKHPLKFSVNNIVKCVDNFQTGSMKPERLKRLGEHLIVEKIKDFYIHEIEGADFDRRVTSLQFHPSKPHVIAIGSKSGNLIIRSLDRCSEIIGKYPGIGPGGSITSISFNPYHTHSLFTSSIDGTVKHRNYLDKTCQTLLDTNCFTKWYCSVNVSQQTGLIITGSNDGTLTVLNKDLKALGPEVKFHKGKINSIEFCTSRGWLMATASLDKTVKLWDVRKLECNSPVEVLHHENAVNTAYFSQTDGQRLLTTDQFAELRVYTAPLFEMETLIAHPHRQFQHLTPIKATWHPLCDLIIVGRYPDPVWPSTTADSELRTIDIISAASGEMKHQLYNVPYIKSLNVFNITGDILASAQGSQVCYWRAPTVTGDLISSEALQKELAQSKILVRAEKRNIFKKGKTLKKL